MQVKRLSITIFVLLFSFLLPSFAQAQQVSIPDPNLAAAIREEIGNSITRQTLLNLTRLEAPNSGITDLTGFEHAHNLRELNLGEVYIPGHVINSNTISDFSPIAGLTQLTELNLSSCGISDVSFISGLTQLTSLNLNSNSISDISPLANLRQLDQLYLWKNSISDVSPLAELKKLTWLSLDINSISDVSSLAKLTQLTWLSLNGNSISDISPFTQLTQLTSLNLNGNNISDVSPLAELTQLIQLDLSLNNISDISPLIKLNLTERRWSDPGLDIRWNPLSYPSINTHIPAMQAKGIEVKFDSRVPTTLVKTSGFAQQGIVNTALPVPLVVEVRDEQNLAFSGVPVTFSITAGSGRLSTTRTTTDVTGRATTRLTFRQAVGTTTVRVTATDVSRPVQFTATAILRNAPVTFVDANLRAEIAKTLRKPLGAAITITDMLKLRVLTANNANIHGLTGLQHASNLTSLSLNNNGISNVAPLAGLTKLTTLNLRNNRISDVLPLTGLTHLQKLDLKGNPLSDTAVQTHIPLLQAAGVNVRFDNRTLAQSGPIVRLIYFRPRDRQPQPDIDAQLDRLIKEVQQFYADQMESRGFGRKTFQFEIDAHGNAVVYHVVGKLDDTAYHDEAGIVWAEIHEQFDSSKYIYLTALDVSSELIGTGGGDTACGVGSGSTNDGDALLPAAGGCFDFVTAAHELGHAFGLSHDFRSDAYLMSYGLSPDKLSQCAAEWLDVHSAFNSNPARSTAEATIEMLPPSFVSSPNAIRLRFKVTDRDGLHQAQLRTDATDEFHDPGSPKLLGCKALSGKSSTTVEFVTTLLTPKNISVYLEVMDVNGNFITSQKFPVDIASLLPSSKVVRVPDRNLAAAIRAEIGNAITTHTILNLTRLEAPNSGITDLTGLEHARNLKELNLGGVSIRATFVNSNRISDFSPLLRLTQLARLDLSKNAISDVSPLSNLTQLTSLTLNYNAISDVSPLSKLTQLTQLVLARTSIRDVSSLSKLTQLTSLNLYDNAISDVSPLSKLTQLTSLNLGGNRAISDVSPLSKLTQLTQLSLGHNSIQDVSPLVNLDLSGTQWDNTGLYLWGNPLSYASIKTHIPTMQAKGIEIQFHDIAYPALVKVSGDGQEATVGEMLPRPFIVEAMDALGKPMKGLTIKFSLTQGDGIFSTKTATTNAKGRARTTLTLGQRLGKHTVRVTANGLRAPLTFTANAGAPPIYWVDKNRRTLHRYIGNRVEDLVSRVQNATDIAVDVAGSTLYWTEQTSETTGKIQRADLDGSNPRLIKSLTSVPRSLTIDPANSKLYITNTWGKIQRMNVDGSNFEPNFITGLDAPEHLTLANDKVYWTEQTGEKAGKIRRANLDGTDVALVKALKNIPLGMAADTANGKLYITNTWGKIQRLNLDGSNFEPNFITGLDAPESLAVDTASGKLYWAETGSIKCVSLSGEGIENVVTGLGTPTDFVLGISSNMGAAAPVNVALPTNRPANPDRTHLFVNYPNPFNPETWIPYQLAKSAEVTLYIYAVNGALVRTLDLGHQPAGVYRLRSRAAYWDGRNELGERVASGIYFYQLTTPAFQQTRRLVILK